MLTLLGLGDKELANQRAGARDSALEPVAAGGRPFAEENTMTNGTKETGKVLETVGF